jgi:hypothetical protein
MVSQKKGKIIKNKLPLGGIIMVIKYVCPHCGSTHGMINSNNVTEAQLGWHFLTPEERQHIISYDNHGDLVANIVCEYCNEAIYRHPELVNPLQ